MALPEEQAGPRAHPRIGRYEVLSRIGKGGMGMVYRARDAGLDREVALKTLTLEGTLDADSRGRFQIEARAAARLQHPNIVTVFELGEEGGLPFIAMELLPGEDLAALARTPEGLLLEESLDVLVQVLRGLGFAHENGIVHRDVKPSNIRILDDGVVKLVDFGIAKLGETGITRTGMMVGTVYYMSPEQIRGGQIDGRTDLFSVGVILFELLSGRRPFRGGGTTEILYKIVHDPTPLLEPDLGPSGPALREIVERALAKEPAARFASAAEMADSLAAVLATCRTPLAPFEDETIKRALRVLRDGRPEEAARRVEALLQANPASVGARRVHRAARREIAARTAPGGAEPDDFPEFASTRQSEATQPGIAAPVTTAVTGTAAIPATAPASSSRRGALLGLAAVGLVAAGVAGALMLKEAEPVAPPPPHLVPVRSEPSGAAIWLDGQDTGLRTDATLSVPRDAAPKQSVRIVLRLEGHEDATRQVDLPLAEGAVVDATLGRRLSRVWLRTEPDGARVELDGEQLPGTTPFEIEVDPAQPHTLAFQLDGHETRRVELKPGELAEPVEVRLPRLAKPGALVVSASYPIDVVWNGRVMARGEVAARVSLAAGAQRVTLRSETHFLDTTLSVDVPEGGEARLTAPALGRVSIRAVPENCEILIDGRFADYPPILELPIASGEHLIGFRWPDGATREERTSVAAGGIAYVTGRR